jgi:hypothetical protein
MNIVSHHFTNHLERHSHMTFQADVEGGGDTRVAAELSAQSEAKRISGGHYRVVKKVTVGDDNTGWICQMTIEYDA